MEMYIYMEIYIYTACICLYIYIYGNAARDNNLHIYMEFVLISFNKPEVRETLNIIISGYVNTITI